MKSILNIVTLVISVEFLADIRRYTDHTIVLMNGMMMFAQGVLGFTAAVFLLNAVWKVSIASSTLSITNSSTKNWHLFV